MGRIMRRMVMTAARAPGMRDAALRAGGSLGLAAAGTAAAAHSVGLAVVAFLLGAVVLVVRPRLAPAAAVLVGAIVMCELAMTRPEAQQVIHYLH